MHPSLAPETASSPCPVQAACGGCPLLGLTRAEQATRKLRELQAELARARVGEPELEFVQVGAALGYRNRIRLRVDGQGSVVFFNPEKLPSCAVLRPELALALAQLQGLGPVPELCGAGHVELRVGDIASRIGLCVYSADKPDQALAALAFRLPRDWVLGATGASSLMPRLDYWLRAPWEQDAGLRYAVPLTSFVQVNSDVNRALVAKVVALAVDARVTCFLDLFSGAGNFSLALLDAELTGMSVEQNAEALAALRVGADEVLAARKINGAAHRVCVADARRLVASRGPDAGGQHELSPSQLIVANPPRAGLFPTPRSGAAQPLAADYARLASQHLALCSCNPASLARDLKALSGAGFELLRLIAFDMFPGTRHLETLAWLGRR